MPDADGSYCIDLADAGWRVVSIRPGGWAIVDGAPVPFRRPPGMRPLPDPRPGGSVDALRPFVNVGSDADFMLIVAWLAAALRPAGPCPILILQGEQGSAKSFTSRVLRRLIDPHATPIRSEPRDERDLMIAAFGSWVVVLDNLSRLTPWLSDALCRLAREVGSPPAPFTPTMKKCSSMPNARSCSTASTPRPLAPTCWTGRSS